VAETTSSQLKVYREPAEDEPSKSLEGGAEPRLARLCAAFSQATGWPLVYAEGRPPAAVIAETTLTGGDPILEWSAPVSPGVGASPGYLRIDLDAAFTAGGSLDRPPLASSDADSGNSIRAAQVLAERLADLLNALTESQTAMRQLQAEMAVAVPHVVRPESAAALARRFDAIVRGGAQGLGCQAAAMYLLDEATTELRMRASWGLDESRVCARRELEDATADLEALVGHAVVLDNRNLFGLWNVPESEFEAAVCIPISSPTTLLGTLWMYSALPRDFSDRETNLMEIIAGCLAVELEREMLLREQRGPMPPT
jgi:hypothetical protein